MEDRCLKQVKNASGISIFLTEEIGDARLRCNQLKNYVDEAIGLIEKSEQREHFFEIAGHLLHGIPDTLMRVDKALSAAAMAVAKWEYEEIKDDLRPEKAEQLEDALRDVRVRRVQRKSSQSELPMKAHEAAEQLKQIVAGIENTGRIEAVPIANLVATLEAGSERTASSSQEVTEVLRGLVGSLSSEAGRPGRLMLAATLRRVLAETMEFEPISKVAETANLDADAQYSISNGLDYIRNAALIAYRRGGNGRQMRLAFDQLASIVSEIGLMCDSIGASDVAGLAIRMSKAVHMARRHLKPDMLDNLVLASDTKESRFEEGKPADPTKNMSDEDATKWKSNTDKYEDQFKAAGTKPAEAGPTSWKV